MGACVSKNSRSSSEFKNQLSKPPQDTQQYNPLHNSQVKTLKFQGTLSNVKIEGNLQEPYSACFQISNQLMRADFPSSQPQGIQKQSIKWKTKEERFKFTANQYDIRTNYLQIKISKLHNTPIKPLLLNLYNVLTGPSKCSFKFQVENKNFIELSYDLKISQVVKVQVKVKTALLTLRDDFPGEHFNFTLELVVSENGKNTRKIITKPSSTMQIPQQKQNVLLDLTDDCEAPVSINQSKFRKKPSSLKNIQKTNTFILWNKESFLPQISFNMTTQELGGSYFWFHCWKITNFYQAQQKQILYRFANFRMILSQLLQTYKRKIIEKGQSISGQTIQVNEQLWSNGAVVGSCKMDIQFTIPEYLKQPQGWMRTQRGISSLNTPSSHTQEQNISLQSFEKLQTLHQKISTLKSEILKQVPNYLLRTEIYKEARKIVSEISKQLCVIGFSSEMISHDDTKKITELCEKQSILLQIMNTSYSLLNINDKNLTEQCWNLLILSLKRGELQLNAIGFNDKQMNELKISELNSLKELGNIEKTCCHKGREKYHYILKRKLKNALEFQRVLYSCLIQSLNQYISFFGQNQSNMINSEVFKGLCFIRIPLFQDHILDKVIRKEDKQYAEFQVKEREWLKSGALVKSHQRPIVKELQWADQFYNPLSNFSHSQELNDQLKKALENSGWVEEISEREGLFYQFCRIVFQKYAQVQYRYKVPKYHCFSGYNNLVAALLNQMKMLKLSHFSNPLIKASIVLLRNEDLYEPVLLLIAKKTNYYDSISVLKCLSIYRAYVNYLTQGNNLLPVSFCYGVFTKIIKQMLESESVNFLVATLMIIYEAYDKFESEFQSYLTLYLLGSKFISLFYHWSYVVRSAFHHLLILKIAQNREIFNPLGTKIHKKLRQSYENVIYRLKILQKELVHQKSKRITQMQINKTYHLKMRHKLWQIKNEKEIQANRVAKHNAIKARNRVSLDYVKIDYRKLNLDCGDDDCSDESSESCNSGWPLIFDYQKKENIDNSNKSNTASSSTQIMIKSQTILEQDQLPEIRIMKSSDKQYTYHQSAKYHGAFFQHEFNFAQFNDTQNNQIQIAHKEFEIINADIRKNFEQKKQLPSLPQQTYALFESISIVPQQIEHFFL